MCYTYLFRVSICEKIFQFRTNRLVVLRGPLTQILFKPINLVAYYSSYNLCVQSTRAPQIPFETNFASKTISFKITVSE